MKSFMFMFIMTNICFSGIIAFGLIQFNKNKVISNFKIVLLSLGFGPPLTATVLYYLLFFFPYRSDDFYFNAVLIFYLLMLISTLCFIIWKDDFRHKINRLLTIINSDFYMKEIKWKAVIKIIIIIGLACSVYPALISYSKGYLLKPLIGHDVLAYGTEGKIYYEEKTLIHKYNKEYSRTGFSNFSRHSPIFPLLLTWEKIVGSKTGSDTDYFFKSLSPFYGLLIIIFVFSVLSTKSVYLALLGSISLFSSFIFYRNLFLYHIDLFRIYFFSAALVFLASSIETKDRMQIVLFFITLGFSAAAHSIGTIVSILSALIFILFYKDEIGTRVSYSICVILSLFILGGFHYFYDTIWGAGWIF